MTRILCYISEISYSDEKQIVISLIFRCTIVRSLYYYYYREREERFPALIKVDSYCFSYMKWKAALNIRHFSTPLCR